MGRQQAPPNTTRRDLTLATAFAALSLAAAWWSARSSLRALAADEGGLRACPMIYPAPPSCHPEWHLQVTALVTLAVLAVLAVAVAVIRRSRGRAAPVTLAVVAVAGLAGWLLAAAPTRLLPVW